MTEATPTLTDFLLARLAEDERACRQYRTEEPRTSLERRMWAEVEAKRRIVEWDSAQYVDYGILRILASAYRDHPDYRAEWAE